MIFATALVATISANTYNFMGEDNLLAQTYSAVPSKLFFYSSPLRMSPYICLYCWILSREALDFVRKSSRTWARSGGTISGVSESGNGT